jgi:hypothetical protein
MPFNVAAGPGQLPMTSQGWVRGQKRLGKRQPFKIWALLYMHVKYIYKRCRNHNGDGWS